MLKKISEKQKLKNIEKKEATRKLHEWLLELWNKLPYKKKCICCGTPIWGECLSTYFDHLLEKSKYAQFAMDIRNIYYPICGDCHKSKTDGFPKEPHKIAIENAKKILLNGN